KLLIILLIYIIFSKNIVFKIMSNNPNSANVRKNDKEEVQSFSEIEEEQKEIIEKDFIPHFLPTYRIKFKFYSIPIVVV
ncbi:unnamed protein product, partial [marine sediment metagenome]